MGKKYLMKQYGKGVFFEISTPELGDVGIETWNNRSGCERISPEWFNQMT